MIEVVRTIASGLVVSLLYVTSPFVEGRGSGQKTLLSPVFLNTLMEEVSWPPTQPPSRTGVNRFGLQCIPLCPPFLGHRQRKLVT